MNFSPWTIALTLSALAACTSKPRLTQVEVPSDQYIVELMPGDMIAVTLAEGTSSFCFGSIDAKEIHAAGGRIVRLDAIQKLTRIRGGCPTEPLRDNGLKSAGKMSGTSAAKSHLRPLRPGPRLGIQICFPDRTYELPPEVGFTEVEKHIFVGGGALRAGETTTHQPVFRDGVDFKSVRAVIVTVRDKDVKERYYAILFPLTIELKKDEWTSWQLPTSRTINDPVMHLLHNRKYIYGETLEEAELDDSAPRVRYLWEDYEHSLNWIAERRLKGEVHDIPPCT